MAMLFIIMKQMMLLVSYLFLMVTNLFGSAVPQPWLDLEGYIVSISFQSASGGKLLLVPFQSAFLPHLAWFLFSHHLLMMHLGGRLVFGFF